MSTRKIALKVLALVASFYFLSVSSVRADDICQADLDYDGKVFPDDAFIMLSEWKKKDCAPNGPAPVPRTWQTVCYNTDGDVIPCTGTGQDGEYRKGVAWPYPLWKDNGDGTITHHLTGLMWTKNAQQISGTKTWSDALTACEGLTYATHNDWRLPNVRELASLIDYDMANPAIYLNPFDNVQSDYYWSSTTYAFSTDRAWLVSMYDGYVVTNFKSSYGFYVWPVRGGHN